jgi:hypothetical protein
MDAKGADSLFAYYRRQSFSPTATLDSPADLAALERERRGLFRDRLALPPAVFRGARLLEVGPDTGANSLVFALWGALCTLSEPNPRAHPLIEGHFGRFGLGDHLVELLPWEVEALPAAHAEAERFDVLDAEGFTYTVRPAVRWLEKFAQLVRDDGFVVVSFYDTAGTFLELLWKVVHSRYRALTGAGGAEAAHRVFSAKWRSIPHRRSLDAWTMDVLENPFVRLEYFLEPGSLCADAAAVGLLLYSSWPSYRSGFDVGWYKRRVDPAEELERQRDFVARGRLGYLFGRQHFLAGDTAVGGAVDKLVACVDELIDDFEASRVARCDELLAAIGRALRSSDVLSRPGGVERSLATVESVRRLLALLADGSVAELEAFCGSDAGFIESWGSPAHFAVFRRDEPVSSGRA